MANLKLENEAKDEEMIETGLENMETKAETEIIGEDTNEKDKFEITDEQIESLVSQKNQKKFETAREHIYFDEKGNPVFKVTRNKTDSKNNHYSIFNYENGEWQAGKGDKETPPYRLPELIEGVEANKVIFVTSGEKDADTLNKFGFIATTAMTKSKSKWKYHYNDYLKKGMNVVILEDHSDYGKEFAQATEKTLNYKVNTGITSIANLKVILKIIDVKITDLTELRDKLQNDERLKELLTAIEKQARKLR